MTVQDYMNLPYTIKVKLIEDESGRYYFANIEEFSGCHADGETEAEAIKSLKEAMKLWIEIKIDNGWEVPLPKPENNFSGKFLVRIPKTLHRKLSEKADEEGISLNQYALYKLSN